MTATYIALATIQLTSTDSEIVFSSIPATYRDLVLVTATTQTSGAGEIWIRYNSDTGSNYSTVQMGGTGSGSGFSAAYTTTRIVPSANIGESTTVIQNMIMQIQDYSQTNKQKTSLIRTNLSSLGVQAQANRWANTNAINTITLTASGSSFTSGSTFSLYGIN